MQRDTTFSLGEITNITQVDSAKISNMGSFVNRIFIAPLEIVVGAVWLYFLVGGWPLFAGCIIMAASLIANFYISKKYRKYRTKMMDAKDKRGKLITEVFSNIRFIKTAGLENYFLQKVVEAKNEEIKWIDANFNRACYSITLNNAVPLLFLAAIFGTYIFIHGALDIPTIFTVMQVFNIFTWNFRVLPYILIYILDLTVSGQRICFFLLSEEIDSSYITEVPTELPNDDLAIEINNGNFYWEDKTLKLLYKEEKDRIADKKKGKGKKGDKKDKKTKEEEKKELEKAEEKKRQKDLAKSLLSVRSRMSTITDSTLTNSQKNTGSKISVGTGADVQNDLEENLLTHASELTDEKIEEAYKGIQLNLKNINIKIKKGQCIALIGKVGSGKSSLLSCLTGELYSKLGSEIRLSGSMAYVSQKAWITSKTIKENILFQKPYDEQRYNDSIKYSCMEDDLKILTKGADTQLGDKGINLSGGQKIRLSIARAMYSNQDIYLFDDPISALDIHVGKFVMEEGIVNYLKGKTRIVATHALPYLKFFDYIYVLDEGEIIEEGDFETLKTTDVYKEI